MPLSKSLYDFLIAGHFPSAVWQFPIISLGVILLFVSIAAIAAVYAPAKRIRNMSITAREDRYDWFGRKRFYRIQKDM